MKGTSPSRVIRAIAGYGIQVPRCEVRTLINSLVCWKGNTMTIVFVGIDLAHRFLPFTISMQLTGRASPSRPNPEPAQTGPQGPRGIIAASF